METTTKSTENSTIMRKLLLLALLLYDVVAFAKRSNNYDYDDVDKRHALENDRRNWRKKALLKSIEQGKDWDDRRRQEYDNLGYAEDMDRRGPEQASPFRGQRRYDTIDKMGMGMKSAEMGQSPYMDKELDKKTPIAMNCDRPHERYEACFSGCAAVSCDNPRERLRPCYPFCEPGCICVQPYVRDDRTHKCVLPDECTKGLRGIPDIGDDV